MARRTASRMDKRREIEAAEALESTTGTTKKKTATRKKKATRKKATTRTRRTKTKESVRKRLVWGIFSGAMKEEARFPYDQRAAAEEKLAHLRSKVTKKMYFIQPVKEPIGDAPIVEEAAEPEPAPAAVGEEE